MNPKPIWLISLAVIAILTLSACGSQGSNGSNEADLQRGKLVFQANCSACHSTTPGAVIVGPSLAGLANRAGDKVEGLDARGYIEQSIVEPGAYINEGFQNQMPDTYKNSLTEEDLNALVAYLMTFD